MRSGVLYLIFSVWLAAQSRDYRQSPGFPAYQKADRLFVANQYQESMNALDDALRLDAKLVPALTLRAKLAMAANRFDVARASLERALAADPSASYAQFLYGFQFYKQNELPQALEALKRAHQLDPQDPRSLLYLGLTQESLGLVNDALASYRAALRIQESSGKLDTDTLLSCARLLLVEGEFEESQRLIQRAQKVAPDSRDPHFELARLLLRKGDAAGAAREGEAALLRRGDATDRQVHFLLVQAYQAAGRESDAARHAAAIRSIE